MPRLLLFVLLTACGQADVPASTMVPSGSGLVVVEATGGLCPTGTCSRTWTVTSDGLVLVRDDPPAGFGRPATLPASQLEALSVAVDSGFGDLAPFTGTCPAAYDGPRYVYSAGGASIDSCVSDVSGSPLIELVHEILGLGSPYP